MKALLVLVVLLYSTMAVNGCNEDVNAERGYVHTPNYPYAYPYSGTCTWVITVPEGFTVGLTWLVYSMAGCPYDYMRVYDGPDSSYPQLEEYCGSRLSRYTVARSTNNTMTVMMVSYYYYYKRGFRAYFEKEQLFGCGGNLVSNNGIVTSPGYPNHYIHMLDCTWVINATVGYNVTLVFTDLDMEDSHICSSDSVKIYDGQDSTSPELGLFCGRSLPEPNMVNATSNYMTIVMVSNEGVNGKGFALGYGIGNGTRNAIIVTTPAHSHAEVLSCGAAMLTFLSFHLVVSILNED